MYLTIQACDCLSHSLIIIIYCCLYLYMMCRRILNFKVVFRFYTGGIQDLQNGFGVMTFACVPLELVNGASTLTNIDCDIMAFWPTLALALPPVKPVLSVRMPNYVILLFCTALLCVSLLSVWSLSVEIYNIRLITILHDYQIVPAYR